MQINLRHLIAANAAASKDDTRCYLKGVQVEVTPHGILCVATDGHMLITCRDENKVDDGRETWPAAGVIVPSELIGRIKLDKIFDYGTISFADGTVTINYYGDSFSAKAIDGTFPAWRAFIPQTLSGEVAQFDVAKLSTLAKASKVLNPKALKHLVKIAHNGCGPALVDFNDMSEVFGVIMPFRGDPPKAVPEWAGLAAAPITQPEQA